MIWSYLAVIDGMLLGATFSQQGAAMKPGSVLTLGEMPFYYYTDADGDQTALPCTERMLSSKMAELVSKYRFMPMLSMKGRREVRLGGFGSLAAAHLAGSWQRVTAAAAAPAPAKQEAAEAEAKVEEETQEDEATVEIAKSAKSTESPGDTAAPSE